MTSGCINDEGRDSANWSRLTERTVAIARCTAAQVDQVRGNPAVQGGGSAHGAVVVHLVRRLLLFDVLASHRNQCTTAIADEIGW